MERRLAPNVIIDPIDQAHETLFRVIQARYDQIGQFNMARFGRPFYRIEDRFEAPLAIFSVKFVVDGFQVYVHRVDKRQYLFQWFGVDVTVRHEDVLQPFAPGEIGGLKHKLIPYERLIISVGYAEGFRFFCLIDRPSGSYLLGLRLQVLRYRPVLAERAFEVAAFGPEREYIFSGVIMVEGFLLDGVKGYGSGLAIDEGIKFPVEVLADTADSGNAIHDLTIVGAKQAMDRSIRLFPVKRFFQNLFPRSSGFCPSFRSDDNSFIN